MCTFRCRDVGLTSGLSPICLILLCLNLVLVRAFHVHFEANDVSSPVVEVSSTLTSVIDGAVTMTAEENASVGVDHTFIWGRNNKANGETAATGDTRCFCNLPPCVTTGYMCKSTQLGCFSEIIDSDGGNNLHGCLELLSKKQSECTPPNAKVRSSPLLICCNDDMCNYNTRDIKKIHIATKLNDSYTGSSHASDGSSYFGQDAALRQDVWFKAATIAVPICGIFVLILLVVLAIRILRKDSKRHQKAMEVRRQRHFKTHHLLHEPHYQEVVALDKNATHAKMNFSQGVASLHVEKQNNVYHNVNVAIATEPVDKTDKCFSACSSSSCSSAATTAVVSTPPAGYQTVVLWGKTNTKPADLL